MGIKILKELDIAELLDMVLSGVVLILIRAPLWTVPLWFFAKVFKIKLGLKKKE